MTERKNRAIAVETWSSLHHAIFAFALVYCTVVVGVLALNAHSVFVRPVLEQGDIAANALAIRDAKALTRITGNYSRFGFDHPGPFFLYVYAFGEALFHDFLGIVPSPHNAHVLSGVLLQAGFFAMAIALFAFWVRSLLFPPLVLLLCSVYFSLLNDASVPEQLRGSVFISIWPPHWVMFPVLCFLSACATLAAGQAFALPIAVFCGSVIVHGYINTPIYIVPIFLAAYVLFLVCQRKTARSDTPDALQMTMRAHLASAAILAIFIFPLVLDLMRGQESNLVRVLEVMKKYEDHSHKLSETIPYIGNYFTFLSHRALHLKDVPGGPWLYLSSQWRLLAFWLLLPPSIVVLSLSARKKLGPRAIINVISALGFAAVWLCIAVYGSTHTIGWLYFYICFHVFSVPILLLILFSASLVRVMPRHVRENRILPLVITLMVFSLPLIPGFRRSISGYEWRLDMNERLGQVRDFPVAIDIALSRMTSTPSCVILDLLDAAKDGSPRDVDLLAVRAGPVVGLLLERMGIPFLANTSRTALFGKSRVLNRYTNMDSLGNYVVWKILPVADSNRANISLNKALDLSWIKSKNVTAH